MSIVTKLNKLGKEVNTRYPTINAGGCCVYAALIVAALHKQGIIAHGIVAAWNNTGETNIDLVRKKIRSNTVGEWESKGVHFNHVGVEFSVDGKTKWKHYDSNGVYRKSSSLMDWPVYEGRLTLKELKDLAKCASGWNTRFDRNSIPALRKLVKTHLSA